MEEFVDSGSCCCGPVGEVEECDVAPVSLMAYGIIPFRTPSRSVVVEGVGLRME